MCFQIIAQYYRVNNLIRQNNHLESPAYQIQTSVIV